MTRSSLGTHALLLGWLTLAGCGSGATNGARDAAGSSEASADAPHGSDAQADALPPGDAGVDGAADLACAAFWACLNACTPANRDDCAYACLSSSVSQECESCMNGELHGCMVAHDCFGATGEPDLRCTRSGCLAEYERCMGPPSRSPYCLPAEECIPFGVSESGCLVGGEAAHPWQPLPEAAAGTRGGYCENSDQCETDLACMVSQAPWTSGVCFFPYCFIAPGR